MVILHIKLKEITKQQHGRNILQADSSTLGMGSIGKKSTFSEHVQVDYQININHKILLQTPPPSSESEGLSKFSYFSDNGHIAYQIPTPTPSPRGWDQKVNFQLFFSEIAHVAYQIKENHKMQQHSSKYFACRPPPHPDSWGQKVKIYLFHLCPFKI